MHIHRHARRQASALILSLSALAILSIAAAYTLRRVSPRFQMASQAAAWQEARLAAESGIDVALADLDRNAVGTDDGAGGFHYDEALSVVGAPIGYRIARYVEDVRE